jgi:hypothetical protein
MLLTKKSAHVYQCADQFTLESILISQGWKQSPKSVVDFARLARDSATIALSPTGVVRIVGTDSGLAVRTLDAIVAEGGQRG